MRKLTLEDFVGKAKCLLGDNYDFTKTTYINSHTKTIITCKKHGDFLVLPLNILQHSSGCPICSKEKKSKSKSMAKESFIKRAKKIHNNKYSYVFSNYINNKTKIKIICPIHGEFEQLPNNHLKGCGCPKCAKSQP